MRILCGDSEISWLHNNLPHLGLAFQSHVESFLVLDFEVPVLIGIKFRFNGTLGCKFIDHAVRSWELVVMPRRQLRGTESRRGEGERKRERETGHAPWMQKQRHKEMYAYVRPCRPANSLLRSRPGRCSDQRVCAQLVISLCVCTRRVVCKQSLCPTFHVRPDY